VSRETTAAARPSRTGGAAGTPGAGLSESGGERDWLLYAAHEIARYAALAKAERRLGRRLSDGELQLDPVTADRVLAAAKLALVEAIEKERRRAGSKYLRGDGVGTIQFTPEMQRIIVNLYQLGQGLAAAELVRAGVELRLPVPTVAFAERDYAGIGPATFRRGMPAGLPAAAQNWWKALPVLPGAGDSQATWARRVRAIQAWLALKPREVARDHLLWLADVIGPEPWADALLAGHAAGRGSESARLWWNRMPGLPYPDRPDATRVRLAWEAWFRERPPGVPESEIERMRGRVALLGAAQGAGPAETGHAWWDRMPAFPGSARDQWLREKPPEVELGIPLESIKTAQVPTETGRGWLMRKPSRRGHDYDVWLRQKPPNVHWIEPTGPSHIPGLTPAAGRAPGLIPRGVGVPDWVLARGWPERGIDWWWRMPDADPGQPDFEEWLRQKPAAEHVDEAMLRGLDREHRLQLRERLGRKVHARGFDPVAARAAGARAAQAVAPGAPESARAWWARMPEGLDPTAKEEWLNQKPPDVRISEVDDVIWGRRPPPFETERAWLGRMPLQDDARADWYRQKPPGVVAPPGWEDADSRAVHRMRAGWRPTPVLETENAWWNRMPASPGEARNEWLRQKPAGVAMPDDQIDFLRQHRVTDLPHAAVWGEQPSTWFRRKPQLPGPDREAWLREIPRGAPAERWRGIPGDWQEWIARHSRDPLAEPPDFGPWDMRDWQPPGAPTRGPRPAETHAWWRGMPEPPPELPTGVRVAVQPDPRRVWLEEMPLKPGPERLAWYARRPAGVPPGAPPGWRVADEATARFARRGWLGRPGPSTPPDDPRAWMRHRAFDRPISVVARSWFAKMPMETGEPREAWMRRKPLGVADPPGWHNAQGPTVEWIRAGGHLVGPMPEPVLRVENRAQWWNRMPDAAPGHPDFEAWLRQAPPGVPFDEPGLRRAAFQPEQRNQIRRLLGGPPSRVGAPPPSQRLALEAILRGPPGATIPPGIEDPRAWVLRRPVQGPDLGVWARANEQWINEVPRGAPPAVWRQIPGDWEGWINRLDRDPLATPPSLGLIGGRTPQVGVTAPGRRLTAVAHLQGVMSGRTTAGARAAMGLPRIVPGQPMPVLRGRISGGAGVPSGLEPLVDIFKGRLGGLQLKQTQSLEGVKFRPGRLGAREIRAWGVRAEVLDNIKGAQAIAADFANTVLARGVANVYEDHADLFDCWQYTAVMDPHTCDICAFMDGRQYRSLHDAYLDMPNFGPNPKCLGGGRCRCRLVPCSFVVTGQRPGLGPGGEPRLGVLPEPRGPGVPRPPRMVPPSVRGQVPGAAPVRPRRGLTGLENEARMEAIPDDFVDVSHGNTLGGSVNEVFTDEVGPDGIGLITKPWSGLQDMSGTHPSIPALSDNANERAAWLFSKRFNEYGKDVGLQVKTPPTVIRRVTDAYGDKSPATLTEKINATPAKNVGADHGESWLRNEVPEDDLRAASLFDAFVLNHDHHAGNYMRDNTDGSLWLIDASLAFPEEALGNSMFNWTIQYHASWLYGSRLNANELKLVDRVIAHRADITRDFESAGLSDLQIAAFWGRMDDIKRKKTRLPGWYQTGRYVYAPEGANMPPEAASREA
jgi:hypothetical protein